MALPSKVLEANSDKYNLLTRNTKKLFALKDFKRIKKAKISLKKLFFSFSLKYILAQRLISCRSISIDLPLRLRI